MSSMAKYKPGH